MALRKTPSPALDQRVGRVMSAISPLQQARVVAAAEKAGTFAALPAPIKKLIVEAEKGTVSAKRK